MLHHRIIDSDHGEFQVSGLIHRFKSYDACCRFLTSAYDSGDKILILCMYPVNQVPAVIYYYIWSHRKHRVDMAVIFLFGRAVPGMYLKAVLYKSRCHIILS